MTDDLKPMPEEELEARLRAAARAFSFPPTPDLALGLVRRAAAPRPFFRRRLVWVGVLLALVLAVIGIVPPVRAAVLDWIRMGAVRIYLIQPTQAPAPTPLPHTPTPARTLTPHPSQTPIRSVLDLSGETTLAQAQSQSNFTLRLPAFPAGLGPPDHVYYQDIAGPVVMLVWIEPDHPDQVRLVLSETSANSIIFQKIVPKSVQDTTVNGQPALWVDAPYLLLSGSGETVTRRLVESGYTLIWTEGPMTYRLELGASLDFARRVAQSLH
jgi:hypothetical protein